ncbi:MAG: transketolase family protein [Bacteroidales bacterium]|nr:transketolase family protein [Bacteroidales bacterium]
MIELGEPRDTKKTYCGTLMKLTEKNPNIVVVEADLAAASGTWDFRDTYPERFYNVGVAEQNLIGFATGLSLMGKVPFAATFSSFLSQRACDQAVNSVAFNIANVKMVGTYAGLLNEKNGGTHISVEDLAIFRSMPNIVVIDPGDAIEFTKVLEFASTYDGPVYIRHNKGNFPTFFKETYEFKLGKSVLLDDGNDIGLITTGITTLDAIKACEELKSEGISVRHVHMPTIKPIDRKEIVKTAEKLNKIVTVENHSVIGGLGSAVAEVLCEEHPVKLIRLGFQDCFGETATADYLKDKFGISTSHIKKTIKQNL